MVKVDWSATGTDGSRNLIVNIGPSHSTEVLRFLIENGGNDDLYSWRPDFNDNYVILRLWNPELITLLLLTFPKTVGIAPYIGPMT